MPKYFVRLLALALVLVTGNVGFLIFDVVDEYGRDDFPAEFVFGSGTSVYQVEGAALEDGRSFSIWDAYAHSGFCDGANGDIACDGYHKYKEDIELMVETGLEAYRFSISWSRLIPNGRGSVNEKGLQFYNDFINRLIAHGIQPHVTLNHIDLPLILEHEYGGWLSRKSVKDFVAFADVCFREFGDRVLHWTTFNEANLYALGGYDTGSSPPGRCSSPFGYINCSRGDSTTEPYLAAHHMLLAHASTVKLYREKYKAMQHGSVGINLLAFWFEPYTNTIQDVKATQRANDFYLGCYLRFLNPLVNGDYPETVKKSAGNRIPTFTKLESEKIKGSFDFLGINHYTTLYIKDNPIYLETDTRDVYADMALIYSGIEFPITEMYKSYNGLPKSLGTNFPNEDDVPRYDQGNENHASLPSPPPINLPNPQVQRLEKFKLTQALLASKHEDGKPVCVHILEMKSHIDRLRMMGVDISEMLAVDWVLQSLPQSYSEFVREYYMMDHDVTLIDLTYLLIAVESEMIWRADRANLSGKSNSQTSMDIENGDIGNPEKVNSEIVPCAILKESICFYCQEKGHWRRSCPVYLRDLRDGRVKTYGSTSGSKKREEA